MYLHTLVYILLRAFNKKKRKTKKSEKVIKNENNYFSFILAEFFKKNLFVE